MEEWGSKKKKSFTSKYALPVLYNSTSQEATDIVNQLVSLQTV